MIAAAMTLMLGCTMTVHAEPVEVVPGVMFDAEYYAKNNPDVTAVMGTDAGALFNHYVLLGQAEGRLPMMWDRQSRQARPRQRRRRPCPMENRWQRS